MTSLLDVASAVKPSDPRAFRLDRAFYPIKDACHQAGISRSWLYLRIAEGKVRVTKIGKKSVISAEVLAGLLAAIRDGAF